MLTHRQFKTKVVVRFVRRDDGGLQASCEGVKGFYLSGGDPRAVMRDVVPALEALVKANYEIAVKVSPLGYGLYQLAEQIDLQVANEPQDQPEYTREYVVEPLAA